MDSITFHYGCGGHVMVPSQQPAGLCEFDIDSGTATVESECVMSCWYIAYTKAAAASE